MLFFVGLFFSGTQMFGQNDTLIMNTGETIVGEIKELKQGILTIETDYSDSDFNIEWDKVVYLKTDRNFLITTSRGDRYHGTLVSVSGDPSKIVIHDIDLDGAFEENSIDVVYFKSVDDSFLSRIDLLMSVGYTLTKANNSHQFSARLNAGYMSNIFAVDMYFSAVRSIQTPDSVTISTKRTEGGLGLRFFVVKDWFVTIGSDFLQSTEQKLDLRALTKGGIGNYIVNSNRM